MDHTQPNRTLTNIADDLEHLAARADRLVPTLPVDEAHMLTEELCAIRALIDEATERLGSFKPSILNNLKVPHK